MRCTSLACGLGVLSVVLGLLTPSSRARASASPIAPAPPPPVAALLVDGVARVTHAQLELSCEDVAEELPGAACVIRAHFELFAIEALELRDASRMGSAGGALRGPSETDYVWVDGSELSEARTLEAGQRVGVEISARRTLRSSERRRGSWLIPAARMRHMLLGDRAPVHLSAPPLHARLLEGDHIRVDGDVRVTVRLPDVVRATVDGARVEGDSSVRATHLELELALVLPPPRVPAVVHSGGPVLSLGARSPLARDAPRFLLRVGHELTVARHFFLNASVETDFESVMESLVFEAGAPMLLILPGPVAGVGVVARQLGHRRADAGLRLRVGWQLPVLGATVDFDYWPSIQQWTATLVARVSL